MGLKEIREERGLTTHHIALLAGCDKATVSRWERGITTPKPETVVKLSKALKVSPGRLT